MENVHIRLKKIKDERGLSTAEISRMLDIHPPTWCKYESGRSKMSIETLYKFCKVLDVSSDYVLGLKG